MKELVIQNRQRKHRLNVPLLEEIARNALDQIFALDSYSCGVHIVSPKKMAQVNWEYLQHQGSTDVITFDHSDYPGQGEKLGLSGEIFISFEDAIKQAQEFSTTPESELVRYVVHGFLHLLGYDDLVPKKRTIMKREENRAVRLLQGNFNLGKLREG